MPLCNYMIPFVPRAIVADGGFLVRMKYHVYSVLANIGAALPCISDWSSGLPRVTGQCYYSERPQFTKDLLIHKNIKVQERLLIIINI